MKFYVKHLVFSVHCFYSVSFEEVDKFIIDNLNTFSKRYIFRSGLYGSKCSFKVVN